MPIYILYGIKYEWNRNISEKICFQGFGTNHPVLHHNFHHKRRHRVQWYYHLSQQFTQNFIAYPWFDAYYGNNVRLDRKYI